MDNATAMEHLSPGERQMVALALAELRARRPGWMYALDKLAVKIGDIEVWYWPLVTSTSDAPFPGPEVINGQIARPTIDITQAEIARAKARKPKGGD
jgi:hypothetical protein